MNIPAKKMRRGLGLDLALMAIGAIGFLASHNVNAEQADRTKQIDIEADVATVNDKNRTRTLEGNVVLTQGTMRFTAERMIVKEDDAGFMTAQAFGGPSGQVAFRQKREGVNDFMEGFADRAEFDDQADTMKLLSRARLKSGGDELKGEYIYYNSATEVMQARNALPDAKGATPVGSAPGRVKITIQPKVTDEKSRQTAPAKIN